MKTDVPKQEDEIKEVEKQIFLNWVETHFWIQLSITKNVVNMLDIFISVLLFRALDVMLLYDLFKVQLYNLYILLKKN